METFDQLSILLSSIFSGEARADVIRVVAAYLFWREVRATRKGLEAVVKRVDNHEGRIGTLEQPRGK